MIQVHRITHKGRIIEFEVIRSSNRSKTSEIIVEPDKVVVRAPEQKSFEEIERIVKGKADWITKKQDEYKSRKLQFANPSFEEGSMLPYLGKNYKLHLFTGYDKEKIRLVRGELLVTLTSDRIDKKRVQSLYENWLMDKGEILFLMKVKYYAKKLDVFPKKIIIKKLQKRWGSATRDNILNLNISLLKAPEDVIDYVILHELCHLKVRNHSHHFWSLLRNMMPDYKQREEWLSVHALGLVE